MGIARDPAGLVEGFEETGLGSADQRETRTGTPTPQRSDISAKRRRLWAPLRSAAKAPMRRCWSCWSRAYTRPRFTPRRARPASHSWKCTRYRKPFLAGIQEPGKGATPVPGFLVSRLLRPAKFTLPSEELLLGEAGEEAEVRAAEVGDLCGAPTLEAVALGHGLDDPRFPGKVLELAGAKKEDAGEFKQAGLRLGVEQLLGRFAASRSCRPRNRPGTNRNQAPKLALLLAFAG